MSAEITIYNPDSLGAPLGQYSYVTRVRGATETLYIAGMVSVDRAGKTVGGGDFGAQMAQTFANISAALESAGLAWNNITLFTTYLVHSQDIPKFMEWRKQNFPKLFPSGKYPPNTLLIVDRLVHEDLLVEVQTIAAR
jgi:enamine deaminase RidA (YjgF/YER057c/UK114 family)